MRNTDSNEGFGDQPFPICDILRARGRSLASESHLADSQSASSAHCEDPALPPTLSPWSHARGSSSDQALPTIFMHGSEAPTIAQHPSPV